MIITVTTMEEVIVMVVVATMAGATTAEAETVAEDATRPKK